MIPTQMSTCWPDDADGGVFRSLEQDGFVFSKAHAIDYNVDFESWPPSKAALELLRSMYGDITVFDPDADGPGCVEFQIFDRVSYEGVTSMQRRTSAAMEPYGGICESWGVFS